MFTNCSTGWEADRYQSSLTTSNVSGYHADAALREGPLPANIRFVNVACPTSVAAET
jgi:hypothetical protein